MTSRTPPALERGLHSRFVDLNGCIRPEAWERAADRRDVVGLCRRCDGLMQPVPTHEDGGTTWYGAECNNCGAGIVLPARHSPGGVCLRRSARRTEMPAGGWTARTDLLTRLAEAGRRGRREAA